MKKVFMKLGNMVAVLALMAATLNVNATCCHYIYQGEIPESAKRLSRVK